MPILAPGVAHIPTSKTDNAFPIEGDDGLTLVDVGRSKAVDLLLRTIAELGHDPSELRRIVLTHAHPDHVQGAPELREHTGARVLIHALVGDAIFHTGKLGYGPATFAADPAARATGAARIPADVTAIGFGHGVPLTGPGLDEFQAFLAAQR